MQNITLKFHPANKKPKDVHTKVLNCYWWNKIDEGNCYVFGFWDKQNNIWVSMDEHASNVEQRNPYMNMKVTHWAEPVYTNHKKDRS